MMSDGSDAVNLALGDAHEAVPVLCSVARKDKNPRCIPAFRPRHVGLRISQLGTSKSGKV